MLLSPLAGLKVVFSVKVKQLFFKQIVICVSKN